MATKRRKQRVTVQQRKLIKGLIDGQTLTQAALDAKYGNGTNPRSAVAAACATLKLINVQKEFNDALEANGISMDSLAKEAKAGLENKDYGKHDSYLKLMLQAKGVLKDQKSDTQQDTDRIFVGLMAESKRRGFPE